MEITKEKKVLFTFLIYLFSETFVFWVYKKSIFDSLSVPASMIMPDWGETLFINPFMRLIEMLIAKRSTWQIWFLYLIGAIAVLRELISFNKSCYKKLFGSNCQSTKLEKVRRVVVAFGCCGVLLPFTDYRIFIICVSFWIYISYLRNQRHLYFFLFVALVVAVLTIKTAAEEGSKIALQCEKPVVLELNDPKHGDVMFACWVFENKDNILLKPTSSGRVLEKGSVVMRRELIKSYTFLRR